jgi:hypothetical protein
MGMHKTAVHGVVGHVDGVEALKRRIKAAVEIVTPEMIKSV